MTNWNVRCRRRQKESFSRYDVPLMSRWCLFKPWLSKDCYHAGKSFFLEIGNCPNWGRRLIKLFWHFFANNFLQKWQQWLLYVRTSHWQSSSACGVRTFYTSPQQEPQKVKIFFMLTFCKERAFVRRRPIMWLKCCKEGGCVCSLPAWRLLPSPQLTVGSVVEIWPECEENVFNWSFPNTFGLANLLHSFMSKR